MTQQAVLYDKIERLPQRYFGEVLDFVGYLEHKAKQEEPENATTGIKNNQGSQEWVNPLLGLATRMGSTLTVEKFHEMQREELALELENEERLWGKK